jgi:phosphoglycerate dehydrogenase-like enzyme
MQVGFCIPMNDSWSAAIAGIESGLAGKARLVKGVQETLAQFSELDAVVANPLDVSYFERSTRLKALFVPFVGVNHLPAELLLERGVAVFNCHGNAESVAERALAMTLAGFGRIIEFHNDLRQGIWHGFWVNKGREDFWHSIFRKRCTILGAGAIGQSLAGLLKAFGCSVAGYRRKQSAPLPPGFDTMSADLVQAVTGAEIVFVTLPLTELTRGLVDAHVLSAMKGAYLVNVGRGDVVVEADLYQALVDGTLSGAALDVWYTYPEKGCTEGWPSRFPFHELPNVVLSPHVAGSTHEAVDMNVIQTVENVQRWVLTGDARHRVDLNASY